MVSSVGTRPNHYEVLGLLPTASEQEIVRAFAKAMGVFGARPLAEAAQLSAAFETLRDQSKRRAYDREIGMLAAPEAKRASVSGYWMVAAAQPAVAGFIGSGWSPPANPGGKKVTPAVPEPAQSSEPDPQARPARMSQPAAELDLPTFLAASRELKRLAPVEHLSDAAARIEDSSWQWKRPALAVGALLLAAGGVGVLAGLSAGGEVEDQGALTVALPAAKAHSEVATKRPAAVAEATQMRADVRRTPEPPSVTAKSIATQQPVATLAAQQVEGDPLAPAPVESAFVESATAQAAGTAVAAPEAMPASMPLPNNVVARTIERIGYACGSVASTSTLDEARGVFKVTCSSGQSYRAAPVRGRYHFSRWHKD